MKRSDDFYRMQAFCVIFVVECERETRPPHALNYFFATHSLCVVVLLPLQPMLLLPF